MSFQNQEKWTFKESVWPEAFFTASVTRVFTQLDREPDDTVFVWIYGVLTVFAFVYVMYAAFSLRSRYRWRWSSSLTYCALNFAALLVSNTDLIRFLVFVGFLVYAAIHYKRVASNRSSS